MSEPPEPFQVDSWIADGLFLRSLTTVEVCLLTGDLIIHQGERGVDQTREVSVSHADIDRLINALDNAKAMGHNRAHLCETCA